MPGFNMPVGGKNVDTKAFSNKAETSRRHRWKIEIYPYLYPDGQQNPFHKQTSGFLPKIQFYAKSCTHPDITYDEIVIHNGQDRIYRPGRHVFDPITLVFYDIIDFYTDGQPKNSLTQKLYDFIPNRERNSFIDQYVYFGMKIKILNGRGDTVILFNIYDCYIENYKPADLDYTDSNISEVTMKVKYNRFEKIDKPSGEDA
jgi:hypothetical protein